MALRELGAAVRWLRENTEPTAVGLPCDAAWNVVAVNGAWLPLGSGAPSANARDWNVAWRTFCNAPGGISRTEEHAAGMQATLVARLRSTSMRYPADASLAELVDELRSRSRPFDLVAHAGNGRRV